MPKENNDRLPLGDEELEKVSGGVFSPSGDNAYVFGCSAPIDVRGKTGVCRNGNFVASKNCALTGCKYLTYAC